MLLQAAVLAVGARFMVRAIRSDGGTPTEYVFFGLYAVMLALGAGSVVLALYGYTVNAPPWDFGRLLGIYVVLFFVVAQLINWLAFGQKPTPSLLLGGILIVAGGLVVSLNR